MGLFSWLFGKQKPSYSKRDIETISASAQRHVDVINESLQIANNSKNPDTKVSRLDVAKTRLHELEELTERYDFLKLTQLDEVKVSIQELEFEFLQNNLREVASGNLDAQALEKEGKVDEALEIYEKLACEGTDTPFTYQRLAIIYRKKKNIDEEIRSIKQALNNVPKTNAKHYEWFEERLKKIEQKQKKKT